MIFEHHQHGIDLPAITRKTTEQGRRYFTPTGEAYPSVKEAYLEAKQKAQQNDFIYVGGSTFVVAEVMEFLQDKNQLK